MLLTAPLIHNGRTFLPQGSVLELTDDGIVSGIHYGRAEKQVTEYPGILCPGFVNAHCHIELSHLKGVIPEQTGLIDFLRRIPAMRALYSDDQKATARHAAYDELIRNGIVAAGDICNTADTSDIRKRNDLHIHSFVECIGFTETQASAMFRLSAAIYEQFSGQFSGTVLLRQSVTAHAPYSVSEKLFRLIDRHQPDSLLSIHNQEAEAENLFYRSKAGAVRDLLAGLGIDDRFFIPGGSSSLSSYIRWLSASHHVLLIHNTYTGKEDVQLANDRFRQTAWCLCPNANLYIENKLPDVIMLRQNNSLICIGTDSLASNHQLCLLSELIQLKKHFAALEWEELLRWGTYNGAVALGMQSLLGSFEPGKKPGILHLSGIHTETPSVARVY